MLITDASFESSNAAGGIESKSESENHVCYWVT